MEEILLLSLKPEAGVRRCSKAFGDAFLEIGVLKNLGNFTGKYLRWPLGLQLY